MGICLKRKVFLKETYFIVVVVGLLRPVVCLGEGLANCMVQVEVLKDDGSRHNPAATNPAGSRWLLMLACLFCSLWQRLSVLCFYCTLPTFKILEFCPHLFYPCQSVEQFQLTLQHSLYVMIWVVSALRLQQV